MRLSAQTGKNELLIFAPVAKQLLQIRVPAVLLNSCVKSTGTLREVEQGRQEGEEINKKAVM